MDQIKDLEKKIDDLCKMMKSQDLLIKAQVNRFNKISSNLEMLLSRISSKDLKDLNKDDIKPIEEIVKKEIESIQIHDSEKPLQPGRHSRSEGYDDKEFTNHQNSSDNVVLQDNFKVELSQRVTSDSGKSIFMAAVEFRDKNTKSMIARVTTKPHGKYNVTLPTGMYEVKISKQPSLSQPMLEKKFDLTIDNKKQKLELPDIIL